ncbi:MAG: hypothetical protein HLUCCX14_08840 [Marinobacter excellens HL-55]|uniref:Uncharacterized protein n=1 Tax=Marinobacter excellens HL-55 TaxID=1305731 RepID=A0A0P8B5B0_9GAMM|nr:MAG: hypothetical protein HLUCCX14_08840 [Marinobacter excellens HL-55]
MMDKYYEFLKKFQSTRPRGARLSLGRKAIGIELFQSTRPRGARPEVREEQKLTVTVSIHAPARGATGISPTR